LSEANIPYSWPGPRSGDVLRALRASAAGGSLRLAWGDSGSRLRVSARLPGGPEIALDSGPLVPAGSGWDPHGSVDWRAGRATLRSQVGAALPGIAIAERLLDGAEAHPAFGSFEMWLLADGNGGLLLGRKRLEPPSPGEALRVESGAPPTRIPFAVDRIPAAVERDAATGFVLPRGWRIRAGTDLDLELRRTGGEAGRGRDPRGGPAVYDVSFAHEAGGTASGLVFHLADDGSSVATDTARRPLP
jgi:hypothetical protein